MRLVACVQDGHSNLFPITPGKTYFHYLPFSIDLFKDGLFVTSAKEEYQHLVGAKILKAGYKTAEEFLEESYQYIGADNLMQKQAMFGLITRISEFYKMASISNDIASIPFLFELENGEQQWVNINGSEPTPAFSPHPLDQHMYHPEGNNKGHKAPAKKNYWFEYQKEHKQVYFQYNQVEDHPHGESLAEFSERLFKFIEKENVERLIIDVRHNSGGNNFLNIPVVTGVLAAAKINQKGKLFTLIGRNTFSAAMNFASEMEKYTQTLFVGEPTGSSPNNYGEHNGFRLPYSGLYGSYSSLYFQGGRDSNDKRPWIAPDILAIPTYEEYKQGHDPAIESILDY